MDSREFQDKLSNLVALAARQDHSLTPEQMRESFAGDDLEKEQMLRILQYLQGTLRRGDVLHFLEGVKELGADYLDLHFLHIRISLPCMVSLAERHIHCPSDQIALQIYCLSQ